MKRREFVEKMGLGSASVAAIGALGGREVEAQHGHAGGQMNGPLAAVTIAFGQWMTDPPLDRFPLESPRLANNHLLIPYMPTVKAGGSVTFAISGFHQVLVYKPGTTMAMIDETIQVASGPGFPPLVADPNNRIYRGPNPFLFIPQTDRIETITIAHPGTYLVTCGVFPHFEEGMHGFIKVVP
jgi:plastocyanin